MGEAKLHVVLLNYTPEPETLIAKAATLCYSPSKIDELTKWVIVEQTMVTKLVVEQIELIGKEMKAKCDVSTLGESYCKFIVNLYNSTVDSCNAYIKELLAMHSGKGLQERKQKALETLLNDLNNLVKEAINLGIIKKKVGSSQKRFIEKLLSLGHFSPVEHASFTFGVEGISRACSHQLVRHRIASYSQQSQRYVGKQSKKTGSIFDFIIPPSVVATGKKEWFIEKMQEIQKWYDELVDALGGGGEKAYEDARFVLPNAAETKIIVTMNARELLHFFRVRCCERVQWEIRALATEMLRIVRQVAPILFGIAGPACLMGPCTEGAFYCGKIKEVRKKYKNL